MRQVDQEEPARRPGETPPAPTPTARPPSAAPPRTPPARPRACAAPGWRRTPSRWSASRRGSRAAGKRPPSGSRPGRGSRSPRGRSRPAAGPPGAPRPGTPIRPRKNCVTSPPTGICPPIPIGQSQASSPRPGPPGRRPASSRTQPPVDPRNRPHASSARRRLLVPPGSARSRFGYDAGPMCGSADRLKEILSNPRSILHARPARIGTIPGNPSNPSQIALERQFRGDSSGSGRPWSRPWHGRCLSRSSRRAKDRSWSRMTRDADPSSTGYDSRRSEAMLVLSRKLGQSFQVGPDVRVTIVKIDRNSVRIGIDAPDEVSVQREEIVLRGAAAAAAPARPGPPDRAAMTGPPAIARAAPCARLDRPRRIDYARIEARAGIHWRWTRPHRFRG